ncbi:DNA double-strand break repair Rad50 ATPase [Entamoeba marina]
MPRQKHKKQTKQILDVSNPPKPQPNYSLEVVQECVLINPTVFYFTSSPQQQKIEVSITNLLDLSLKASFNEDKQLDIIKKGKQFRPEQTETFSTTFVYNSEPKTITLLLYISFPQQQNLIIEEDKGNNKNIEDKGKDETNIELLASTTILDKETESQTISNEKTTLLQDTSKDVDVEVEINFTDVIEINKDIPLLLKLSNNVEKKKIYITCESECGPFTTHIEKKAWNYTNKGVIKNSTICFTEYFNQPFIAKVCVYDDSNDDLLGIKYVQFDAVLVYGDTPQTSSHTNESKESNSSDTKIITPEIFEDFQINVVDVQLKKNTAELTLFLMNCTPYTIHANYKQTECPNGFSVKGSFDQQFEVGSESYCIFDVNQNRKETKCEGILKFALSTKQEKDIKCVPFSVQFHEKKPKKEEFPSLVGNTSKTTSTPFYKKLEKDSIENPPCLLYLLKDISLQTRLYIMKEVLKQLKNTPDIDLNLYNIVLNDSSILLQNIKKNCRSLESSFSKMTSFFLLDEFSFINSCLSNISTSNQNDLTTSNDDDVHSITITKERSLLFSIGTLLYSIINNGIDEIPYWEWDQLVQNNEIPVQFTSNKDELMMIYKMAVQCWKGDVSIETVVNFIDEHIYYCNEHLNNITIPEIKNEIQTSVNDYKQKETQRYDLALKADKPPFFDKPINLLIVLKVDYSIFGVFIKDTAKFYSSAFHLDHKDYTIFSMVNQYETKPFEFNTKGTSELRFFPRGHDSFCKLMNVFDMRRVNILCLSETQMNQHLECGIADPSHFFSNNKKPISQTKKPIKEFIFYELNK